MAKKPSMGRQKIKIAKIETKNHLQVTFSKRRSGLFKKASELCTLCGVEITIIVFSPAGKVFSFGHPNVDSIVDRFLSRNPHLLIPNSDAELHRGAAVREMNLHLTQMMAEIESEKKRGEALDRMRMDSRSRSRCWWEAPICELGMQELEVLRESMEELKISVGKIMVEAVNNASAFLAVNGTPTPAAGIFDLAETKPQRIIVNNNNNNITPHDHHELHNYGYDHGFF